MGVLTSCHELIEIGPLWLCIKQGQAFPALKSTGGVASKSDSGYVFVFLHLHFLVEPQERSQGWRYPVEEQAHAWGDPTGNAFKSFFPAQALMTTYGSWRSRRRGQFLQLRSEGTTSTD
jgi:hypothetical protein